MSYDVQVFGRRQAELSTDFVAGSPGLVLGRDGRVLRGRRATYSFTVDGPFEVEPEDVPEDVLAHVLEPRWMWAILVEGSSEAEIPHAVRFAKRLAKAAEGAALDPQTGEVLAKVGSRATVAPPKDTRIDLFELHWYAFADAVRSDPVDDWIELCGRYLPEALPRRYGEYEPLQHRLDREGPTHLRGLLRTEGDRWLSSISTGRKSPLIQPGCSIRPAPSPAGVSGWPIRCLPSCGLRSVVATS